MFDTSLEEDQKARFDPRTASDAQLRQMAGMGQPEPIPNATGDAVPEPLGLDEPMPTAQDAGAPPPVAAPGPQTPVDLLAQVRQGQISRPALDKAFGPPPTPQNEPGAALAQPGAGSAQGLDWKGLADRLSAARGRQSGLKNYDNTLNNINSVLNPHFKSDSGGDDEVAGAEDELKLAQAKQTMETQAAQEGDRKAQLQRQNAGDEWRQIHERMQLTQSAQLAADKAKAEAEKEKYERDFKERKLAADTDAGQTKAEREAKAAAGAEKWKQMNYAQRERAIKAAEAERDKKHDDGAKLPATEGDALADVDVAKAQLDHMSDEFDRLDMGGMSGKLGDKVTKLLGLQDTDSAEFEAVASRVRQAVGKILEGGKLAAGDEAKYRNMLLVAGDSPAVKRQKVEGMKAFLDDLKSGRIKVLKSGGYRTPEQTTPEPAKAGGGAISVSLRRKSDGRTVSVSAERAKAYQAKDPDAYEVVP